MNEIADVVNRLYRLATQIRNPNRRLQSGKARIIRTIDNDKGAELMQAFREFDKEHIRQLFLTLRSKPSKDPESSSSAVAKVVLDNFDEALICRLAEANTYR